MVGPVHGRAHQIVETGVDQREVIAAHRLRGAHLGQQHSRLGSEVAPGLDLELHPVTEVRFDAAARVVPDCEVRAGVEWASPVAIRNRKAAAARDGAQIASGALHGCCDHGVADCGRDARGRRPSRCACAGRRGRARSGRRAPALRSRFSCQMPCLLDSPPVLTLWLCPWPKPGLMRSQTG